MLLTFKKDLKNVELVGSPVFCQFFGPHLSGKRQATNVRIILPFNNFFFRTYWPVQMCRVKCSGLACFGRVRKMYWIRKISILVLFTQQITQVWTSLIVGSFLFVTQCGSIQLFFQLILYLSHSLVLPLSLSFFSLFNLFWLSFFSHPSSQWL